jgi:NADH:ubiquinone oxidoreductase subunit 2 (subunit N)
MIFVTIICSFLFGTLGAIYQIKLKKFLAYSAIANMDLFWLVF